MKIIDPKMIPITSINTHMMPVMIIEPKANISEEHWTQRRYLPVNINDQKTIPVMIIEPKVNVKYKDNWPKEINIYALKQKMKQLYPPKALMEIYKSCCKLVFQQCKTTTTFGLVTVADMLSNTI